MGRNKRKISKISNKSIMCLTSIVALNLIGISYATWNNDLDIRASVSTGTMEPFFIEENLSTFRIMDDNTQEYLDVDIRDNKVKISGNIRSAYEDEIYIEIGDDGTIPFKFEDLDMIDNDEIVQSIRISDDDVHLHIQAKNIDDGVTTETQHTFEYKLIFNQWK
ncbi:hypothetical protein [Vallitalea okinawensis]|uniref:hypothetical protein n=1 Tax=Vallitalea okinawensis TaxID=2078660 RepID=UPI000CFD1D16|nr:hypothetical protein [Vallitalea okinawensis]